MDRQILVQAIAAPKLSKNVSRTHRFDGHFLKAYARQALAPFPRRPSTDPGFIDGDYREQFR